MPQGNLPTADNWLPWVASVGGFVIAALTLVIAVVQFRKTRSAADAAREAATAALAKVLTVQDVAGLERLAGRTKDLLLEMKGRNRTAVVTAARELGAAMARYAGVHSGRPSAAKVDLLRQKIKPVQLDYQKSNLDKERKAQLAHAVSEVHEELEKLSGEAVSDLGNDR